MGVKGFLRFVSQTHGYLGYRGRARIEVRMTGGGSYLTVPAEPEERTPHFHFISEQTELASSAEAGRADLEGREAELANELTTRLAWHFGQEDFPA